MILAIVNPKGGSGKSALAINLAGALAERGPVAVVDLDTDNRSALDYASSGRLPFTVTDPHDWDGGLNRQSWAHVIADTYARPPAEQLADLTRITDVVLMPTPPDAFALRVLARYVPEVAATGARYAVVLTNVPPLPSRARARAMRDLQAGGVPVMNTYIPRAAAIANAARAGRLARDMPGGRRARLAFDALAQEVLTYASP